MALVLSCWVWSAGYTLEELSTINTASMEVEGGGSQEVCLPLDLVPPPSDHFRLESRMKIVEVST